MTSVTFFSDDRWTQLYPLHVLHRLGRIRVGGYSLREQWSLHSNESSINEPLQFENVQLSGEFLSLNDRWVPSPNAFRAVEALRPGERLMDGDTVLASYHKDKTDVWSDIPFLDSMCLNHPTDLFRNCGEVIADQTKWLLKSWKAKRCTANDIPDHVTVIGDPQLIVLAPGAQLLACTLNTTDGPILVGPNAEIQEGCNVRGPLLLDVGSVLKMGAKVYGPTSIGPHCRIGGEVSNSAFLGFSNKGHDGFVGNSIIGNWCNLGAGTNTSNLKNNYSSVRLWDAESKQMKDSDLLFCGLILGDHSKCGINTMFNSATTVGVGANIFGASFPPKHVPSFAWGGEEQWQVHQFDRFIDTAKAVMARRDQKMIAADRQALEMEFNSSTADL